MRLALIWYRIRYQYLDRGARLTLHFSRKLKVSCLLSLSYSSHLKIPEIWDSGTIIHHLGREIAITSNWTKTKEWTHLHQWDFNKIFYSVMMRTICKCYCKEISRVEDLRKNSQMRVCLEKIGLKIYLRRSKVSRDKQMLLVLVILEKVL